MTSLELAKKAARLLDDKKAERVNVIEIQEISSLGDYFVIATGTSTTHVRALADELEEKLKAFNFNVLTINGHEIIDVLDYRFYGYDTDCRLELREPSGAVRTVSLRKPEGRDLGLNFDTVLMDEMRSCANHCIFCFVDQMPPGMRKTLYFKDDDARLSFLQGNYITLTNLTDREAQRINE